MLRIVVIGGGIGGLAAAVGLAREGHNVTLLEKAATLCPAQSGPRGSQSRLHSGAMYAEESPEVAAAIYQENSLIRELPRVVANVRCFYAVPARARWKVVANWRAAAVPHRMVRNPRTPFASSFCAKHDVTVFQVADRLINRAALQAELERQFREAGGQALCNHEVMGASIRSGRIAGIIAKGPQGLTRLACDIAINVTGGVLAEVAERITARNSLGPLLELVACPVLRCPRFGDPMLLQAYGDGLADQLAVIPIAETGCRDISIATRGGVRVESSGFIPINRDAERQRLERLVAEIFEVIQLPDPVTVSVCLKANLLHPARKAMAAGSRLITVIPGPMIGDPLGVVHASPNELGSCLSLRDAVSLSVSRVADELAA